VDKLDETLNEETGVTATAEKGASRKKPQDANNNSDHVADKRKKT